MGPLPQLGEASAEAASAQFNFRYRLTQLVTAPHCCGGRLKSCHFAVIKDGVELSMRNRMVVWVRTIASVSKKRPPQRLSREEWLGRALEILSREGNAKLRVEAICAALGVTKGSFYWHFRDRDDFVRSAVEHWSTQFTDPVVARVVQAGGEASERLKLLMRVVSEEGLARYEVSVRAWAAQEPELVEKIVKAVDERRIEFVGALFAEMGFKRRAAEMRARACIAYLSFEASVLAKSARQERSKMLDEFFGLITRP